MREEELSSDEENGLMTSEEMRRVSIIETRAGKFRAGRKERHLKSRRDTQVPLMTNSCAIQRVCELIGGTLVECVLVEGDVPSSRGSCPCRLTSSYREFPSFLRKIFHQFLQFGLCSWRNQQTRALKISISSN